MCVVTAPRITKADLIADLQSGCRPRKEWRIGTEHEKFAFNKTDLRPIAYEGPAGVRAFLSEIRDRFGWTPVREGDHVIALSKNGCSVSLEPGGQIELSGAPLTHLHETCAEVHMHLNEVRQVGDDLGIALLGIGHQPKWAREDIPMMPKGRYKIMRDHMPKVGKYGLDMMFRTCTIQVNLDFESEADMVEKFRIALALQPVATALFASSPFVDGKPTGWASNRARCWQDTDPARTGMLPFVFEDGFGFERFVDYLLDVPMYFVHRDGKYIDAAGLDFKDFMAGKLPALPGEYPTLKDWADHQSVSFPEVRLKKFLEMRGADGGPWRRICALPALWVGLLYDETAQRSAYELIRDFTAEEREFLRLETPRTALQTPFRGGTIRELAKDVLDIARGGLKRRARPDSRGDTEEYYLDPLVAVAEDDRTLADEFLDLYETRWGETVDPLFTEYAY